MKKTISTLAVLFCMGIASQAAATPILPPTLTLTPDTQSFPVGETRSVTVGITGLGDYFDQSSLILNFDDTLLDFVSLTWATDFMSTVYDVDGNEYPGYGLSEQYIDKSGRVSFGAGWFGGVDQIGGFDIATLTFSGTSVGTSLLALTGDVSTCYYCDGSDDIFYTDLSASATMAPVPEPASLLLLGTGLAGLCGFRRKSRKQDQAA